METALLISANLNESHYDGNIPVYVLLLCSESCMGYFGGQDLLIRLLRVASGVKGTRAGAIWNWMLLGYGQRPR